jgi:hypothetical protein
MGGVVPVNVEGSLEHMALVTLCGRGAVVPAYRVQASCLELLPSLLVGPWTVSAPPLAPAGLAAFLCLAALLPLKLPGRARVAPLGD